MFSAESMLKNMATKSLYAKSDFFSCGKSGCMLANVDLSDSVALLEALKAIKSAKEKKLDYNVLAERVLKNFEYTIINEEDEAQKKLLAGDALVFLDGEDGCLSFTSRKYVVRAIIEPPTSGVIRGPREGFIEDLKTNLSLIERRLKNPALKIEKMKIGKQTSTDVAVVSLETVADKKIVEQIKKKLKEIDIDGILASRYLQEYLEPKPYSIFDQVGICEKPDIVVAKLLEGRVAVFCDGTPIVITIPFMFLEDIQSSEDYYERSYFSSLLRYVRFFAMLMGVFLPGLYVALEVFHFAVIPLKLLNTIVNAIQGVPFPPLAEVLFVILLFEIIREAGIRMPQAVGMALSVVGALVLGDTAVKAGFIGSTAVMIVALSSIALYTVPNAVGSGALLRVLFTVIGGFFGLYGMLVGIVFLLLYLCTMNGFGTPYMAPYAPGIMDDKKDGLIKRPLIDMTDRPKSIKNKNPHRIGK